jgi:hypothetical protein
MTRAAKGQSPWSPLVRIRHLSIHPRCAACHAGSRDCPRLGLPTLGHLQCEKDSNALFLYLFSFPSMPLSPHPRSILPGNPHPAPAPSSPATLRRNGVWRTNFNELMTEPVYRSLTAQWYGRLVHAEYVLALSPCSFLLSPICV